MTRMPAPPSRAVSTLLPYFLLSFEHLVKAHEKELLSVYLWILLESFGLRGIFHASPRLALKNSFKIELKFSYPFYGSHFFLPYSINSDIVPVSCLSLKELLTLRNSIQVLRSRNLSYLMGLRGVIILYIACFFLVVLGGVTFFFSFLHPEWKRNFCPLYSSWYPDVW